MEESLKFLPLLLLLLLAFVVPLLLARARWMPLVVGEIIVGLLVGPSGFGLIGPEPTLEFLAEIGLALLMFLSGLEVDFSLLTQAPAGGRRWRPQTIATLSFIATLVLAGAAGLFLTRLGVTRDPLMVALILSTTSLGVVIPVLKEKGESQTPLGQAVILSALAADFFTMFLITVYVAAITHGLSLNILLVGILFVAALLAYRLGVIRMRRLHLERILASLSRTSGHVKTQAGLALMLGFVILAKFLGTEMILGAFLAGAVLSLLKRGGDQESQQRLEAIGYGFFVPLFFITVGIGFDLRTLFNDGRALLLAPLLLAAAFLIKLASSLVFRVSFTWRQTLAGGILLSARLSLIIAAAGIGASLNIISDSTNAAFILVAALTSTVAPVLFNRLVPTRGAGPEKRILIVGANDTAQQVGRELELRGNRVAILAESEAEEETVRRAGFGAMRANGECPQGLPFNPADVRSVLLLDASDGRNLRFARLAAGSGIAHLIALVHDPLRLPEFHELNVQTFTPAMFRSTLLALMAVNPDLFALLSSARGDQQVRQITLENPAAAGRLQDLQLGADLLVLSIRRGRERLIPHGKTRLEKGDQLTVLGNREALRDLANRLEGKGPVSFSAFH
jgi:Kef-type K+ transport system membrane component KefB